MAEDRNTFRRVTVKTLEGRCQTPCTQKIYGHLIDTQMYYRLMDFQWHHHTVLCEPCCNNSLNYYRYNYISDHLVMRGGLLGVAPKWVMLGGTRPIGGIRVTHSNVSCSETSKCSTATTSLWGSQSQLGGGQPPGHHTGSVNDSQCGKTCPKMHLYLHLKCKKFILHKA